MAGISRSYLSIDSSTIDKNPMLEQVYRAYQRCSPETKNDVGTIVMGIVTAVKQKNPQVQFSQAMGLELLGALLERGII